MIWNHRASLPWTEPLDFAENYAGGDMALLYSGQREGDGGATSYLFSDPVERIAADRWDALPVAPPARDGLPYWVGHLGYGLRRPKTPRPKSIVAFPDLHFTRYARLWRFDHTGRRIDAFGADGGERRPGPEISTPAIAELASDMPRAAYEAAVADAVERIRSGDFYQANLTRKFFGRFAEPPSSWQLFRRLCAASPAPYSAYLRDGDAAMLSSSPECFLQFSADGRMTARPIKGSARRAADATEDAILRDGLRASSKNLAENLMITDLMRNDLSRACVPGSVRVRERAGLYSYRTIHHLVSTVEGMRRTDCSVREALEMCFPPGSMTGAPKIAAMRWCESAEPLERGVYSGAIGWLGDGVGDFSVVIRTLLVRGDRFEFQVGGGIVADSTPEDEWRETMVKARGILQALGLEESAIAML